MLLGTIGGAASGTINITFVPQFLLIRGTAGADLTGDITISINVLGDGVIMNLDAAGFDAMSNIKQFFQAAADINTTGRLYQLAEGVVLGKNTQINIANADAAAVDVYGFSKQKLASYYLTYNTQLALQSSGADFENFAYLSIPAAGATDNFSVLYNDGTDNPGTTLNELRALEHYNQTPTAIALNNIAPARVKKFTIIPAANRNVYVMAYQPVRGSVDAAVLNR